ncbi:MAG: TAXI family TRAP transporter solute-binding subunit [Planctomycetota bacterium]
MRRKKKGWRIWAGAAVFSLLVFLLVRPLIPPPLPKTIRIGTGAEGGRYTYFGAALRDRLEQQGFEVELVSSRGSADNVAMLERGDVDCAFVQGGVVSFDAETTVRGIASLFWEPIWIFHRHGEQFELVRDLKGRRIAIGKEGSGTQPLIRSILAANGVRDNFVSIGGEAAFEALAKGEVDACALVQAPTEEWIHSLVEDGRFDLLIFARGPAYAARFRHLSVVDVPRGFVDFELDLPKRDVQLLATTANLAIGPHSHPSLTPLLIETSRDELAQGSLLAAPGKFPSLAHIDLPLEEDAVRYHRTGPKLFYRYMPFQAAYALDRLIILLIPLLTLLYPLFKGAGPLYRWTVFRRIYPWYKVLQQLEEAIETAETPEERAEITRQLEELDQGVAQIHVPARYTAEIYELRRHIAHVVGQNRRPASTGD